MGLVVRVIWWYLGAHDASTIFLSVSAIGVLRPPPLLASFASWAPDLCAVTALTVLYIRPPLFTFTASRPPSIDAGPFARLPYHAEPRTCPLAIRTQPGWCFFSQSY